MNTTNSKIPESPWKGVYTFGAAAALLIAVVYLVEMVLVITTGLPPDNVAAWFALFQADRTLGVLKSFSLDILATACSTLMFLALYAALRKSVKSAWGLILALVLAFIGLAVYFSSNITFSMLSLSDQYAAATTDAQRAAVMAAGQAMLAVFNGTGPFMAFLLNAVAGIIISVLMLQSRTFSRLTAWLGIIGNALELGLPPGIAPAFFLKIDPVLIGIGGLLLIFWYLLIAQKLFRLERLEQQVLS